MTRSMTWNEMFTRAGMYLTVVSAATVALALMAQATNFDNTFRLFALLVLPVVLFIGFVTHVRISDARGEDVWFVIGMNRLRHGYLEIAPELAPYFITSQYDDMAGVAQTYGAQGSAATDPYPREHAGVRRGDQRGRGRCAGRPDRRGVGRARPRSPSRSASAAGYRRSS